MTGTIVNVCAIIAGTLTGWLLHGGIGAKYREVLYNGLGLASVAIGLNAVIGRLPASHYPVLFIVALAVGGVAGTALDVQGRFNRLTERLAKGSPNLGEGLSLAVLLYCVGPLSMLGPVVSALKGDNTLLFTNATLDFVSSTVFASTYGLGMVLAAPVLLVWQGMFYVVALASGHAVSDALMGELLIVGGVLIAASGLSLLRVKDCKVLNLLPALLVPVLWFIVKSFF